MRVPWPGWQVFTARLYGAPASGWRAAGWWVLDNVNVGPLAPWLFGLLIGRRPHKVDTNAERIRDAAELLLLTYKDPAKAAQKLKGWITENLPDRVSTAYWVTLTEHPQRDKGIAVEVYKLPMGLRLRAVFGGWSAGAMVFAQPIGWKWGGSARMRVSLGVGAVAPYADPDDWTAVAGAAVSW